MDNSLAADVLKGVKEIGDFIGEDERRTYYLCETGQIPVFKQGRLYRARKSTLRAYYDAKCKGEVA